MPIDKKFIGKKYTAPGFDLSKVKIREYVRAVGDLNPLYLDEEYAAHSKYGSIIAPPVMAEVAGKKTLRGIYIDLELKPQFVMHGSQEMEFYEVLRPGDELFCESYITKIKEMKDRTCVVIETFTTNQKGRKVGKGKCIIIILKEECHEKGF